MVKICKKVKNYSLVEKREVYQHKWGRKVRICYRDLPVKVDGKNYFLDAPSKQLKRIGNTRNCSEVAPVILISDEKGKLWKLSKDGQWLNTSVKGQLIQCIQEHKTTTPAFIQC